MYEMYGVAAGVIGGVSPLGGTGILLGTLAGAAVWQTLENGLTFSDTCQFDSNNIPIQNIYFNVDQYKGTNCNADGQQITKIYGNNSQAVYHNWIECDCRYPVFVGYTGQPFIYCAHKGKWYQIGY